MAYRSTAKPTMGNLRRRVQTIRDAAESAHALACRWNPKGRYFKAQRDLIRDAAEIRQRAERLLERLRR